jgi:hypothetical protein
MLAFPRLRTCLATGTIVLLSACGRLGDAEATKVLESKQTPLLSWTEDVSTTSLYGACAEVRPSTGLSKVLMDEGLLVLERDAFGYCNSRFTEKAATVAAAEKWGGDVSQGRGSYRVTTAWVKVAAIEGIAQLGSDPDWAEVDFRYTAEYTPRFKKAKTLGAIDSVTPGRARVVLRRNDSAWTVEKWQYLPNSSD